MMLNLKSNFFKCAYSLTHSINHHSLTHSLTHPLTHSHIHSQTNNGTYCFRDVAELDAGHYGLTDMAQEYNVSGILHTGQQHATLEDIITSLKFMYCGPLTSEFAHLLVRLRFWIL